MAQHKFFITALLVFPLLLQGCAGVRNSYESLLDAKSDNPLIVLKVGDKREVLAVGDGFPGRWGYHPAIASHDPEVASVTCNKARSFIPFREPGTVFGGERCYIEAHKTGITWLLSGNKYTLRRMLEAPEFNKSVSGETGQLSVRAEGSIEVKVVAASDR